MCLISGSVLLNVHHTLRKGNLNTVKTKLFQYLPPHFAFGILYPEHIGTPKVNSKLQSMFSKVVETYKRFGRIQYSRFLFADFLHNIAHKIDIGIVIDSHSHIEPGRRSRMRPVDKFVFSQLRDRKSTRLNSSHANI